MPRPRRDSPPLPPIGSLVSIQDDGPESVRLAIVVRHLGPRRDGLPWVEVVGSGHPYNVFVSYMDVIDAAPPT